MRAVAIASGGAPELVDVPEPDLGPDDLLIEVNACGICGSDVHFVREQRVEPNVILGHEIAGTIVRLGDAVSGRAVGERVVVAPFTPCGACATCRDGAEHLCPEAMRDGIGLGRRPGGFAERLVVRSTEALALAPGLALGDAAIAEPLAVAIHGLRVAGVRPSHQVAVLGAGAIGLLASLTLRARGQESLVLVEPHPGRAARARELGFEVGTPSRSSIDIVVECAGHPAATAAAIEHVRRQGTVALLGVVHAPVPVSQLRIVTKEVSLRGSFGYARRDFHTAIELLESGTVRAGDIVTASPALEAVPAILHGLAAGASSEIKVLISPSAPG